MPFPSTEVRRGLTSAAVAAGGTARFSIPIRGARTFSYYVFGTLGGGTAAITFSALGAPASAAGVTPTASVAAATLVHLGCVEIQAPTNANVGTTGATGVYHGIEPASGTPAGITGHNFDVIITITGGTGAVLDAWAVVTY